MTEKQEEICECGHDYRFHTPMVALFKEPSLVCEMCSCKKFTPKSEVVILDDNEISIMKYAEEYPENWKKICKALEKPKNHSQPEERRRRYKHTRAAQNQEKGCGKDVDCYGWPNKDGGWKCGQQYLNEEIILCPTCQEKEK